ncbi:spore germination protein [Bacillus sp. 03113]|uniref:spore germination protein n=1 Tax=Bacillus sp. 03113 TaxID=2578211 RepID=UPI001143021C|nr:spore germination protein [Bacillus sp. 03113]
MFLKKKSKKPIKKKATDQGNNALIQKDSQTLNNDLQLNINEIKEQTGNSTDITIREVQAIALNQKKAAIIYISGISDIQLINNDVLLGIMLGHEKVNLKDAELKDPIEIIKNQILSIGSIKEIDDMESLLASIHSGNTVILVDGCTKGIMASSSNRKERGVEEPSSQTVIRGPKEGFVENIGTNIALLRSKIKTPNLWKIDRKIGKLTQTDVSVMYIKGIANDKIVTEIMDRLDRIDTDSILESGYIEEFIQDQTSTTFPTIMNTERPDSVAAALLEGQIAIIVDGTPFVLIAPVTFFNFFQASEDYYQRYDIATFLRILRYIAFFVSMLLPSIYIAITTFHQEMLPTTLLIGLSAQREGVPFPAFVEALLMEFTFEFLREAGVRMPRAIGPAVSIVGALVLGQAAVQAGLVSAAMVIMVSFTAISNFVAPILNISITARLIRFGLMLLAASLGLFGIIAGLFAILIHMLSIRSFGIPYLAPLSPLIPSNLKDIFIRVPWWAMSNRPRLFSQQDNQRQKKQLQPSPPKNKRNE